MRANFQNDTLLKKSLKINKKAIHYKEYTNCILVYLVYRCLDCIIQTVFLHDDFRLILKDNTLQQVKYRYLALWQDFE